MTAVDTVNEWLGKLVPGDPGMVLNQHGQCQIMRNGTEQCIVFVTHPASTEFHLFQDLAPLSATAEARFFEEVMKLNLPGQATRGGTIGIDPQTRQLVFAYTREIAATDIKTFCAVLDNFFDTAGACRKLVQALVQAPASTARGSTASRLALLNR